MFRQLYGSALPTVTAGDGPLVILCHGVTDSAASLSDLQERLSHHYRVVAIDSLGHGLARRPRRDELTDPMASALGALADTVSALVDEHGPAVGIGHSMGGALLSRLACDSPELFAGIIAEDPAWLTPEQHAHYERNVPASLNYHRAIRRRPIRVLKANRREYPSWPEAERAGWLAGKLQVDLELLAAGRVGYVDWNEWVGTLTVPTLVITGDGFDVVLGEAGLADVERLTNPLIATELVAGARHCVRRENPQHFHELILPFLEEVQPPWRPDDAVRGPNDPAVEGEQPSQTASFHIDPELSPMLDEPYFPAWDVAGTRERGAEANANPAPIESRATLEVREVEGVEARVWSVPEPDRIIIALHGGGYTAGSARYDDAHNAHMSDYFNAVVVSPDYRLAPEHPFPAAGDDALAVALWAFRSWNLPRVIYGDSAGGGLAETLAVMLLNDGDAPADAVIALEPFIDPAQSGVSHRTHADAQMWNRNKAYHGWRAYLADTHPSDLPRLVKHANNPRKPAILTVVASADLLRDEGIRWTTQLVDAGFDAQLHMMAGTFHSALADPATDVGRQVDGLITHFLTTRGA